MLNLTLTKENICLIIIIINYENLNTLGVPPSSLNSVDSASELHTTLPILWSILGTFWISNFQFESCGKILLVVVYWGA